MVNENWVLAQEEGKWVWSTPIQPLSKIRSQICTHPTHWFLTLKETTLEIKAMCPFRKSHHQWWKRPAEYARLKKNFPDIRNNSDTLLLNTVPFPRLCIPTPFPESSLFWEVRQITKLPRAFSYEWPGKAGQMSRKCRGVKYRSAIFSIKCGEK